MSEELMLKVENVSKKYRLGQIGGGTLKGDLQSWMARVTHREDPNMKIGETTGKRGDEFMALKDISFEVQKGQAVGIIGHNGAGKSTLLKLISRVTAPTEGSISMNGRIASMLEVGTGFHPELTGRENVYMNGAILGMTKAEIDAKMDEIIEFSEVRQFIDTPVKRYSSGMYVKLAFSVASHLDSEIMIMDEVLAVGDTAFQRKCINRMREVANSGRTILYVSHNMETIRALCDRCIVLEHGHLIFDGDVEGAIGLYNVQKDFDLPVEYNFTEKDIPAEEITPDMNLIKSCRFIGKEVPRFGNGETMNVEITFESKISAHNVRIMSHIRYKDESKVANFLSDPFDIEPGVYTKKLAVDIDDLVTGQYSFNIHLIEYTKMGDLMLGRVSYAHVNFEKYEQRERDVMWHPQWFGNIHVPTKLID